jgi:hypothetical protein
MMRNNDVCFVPRGLLAAALLSGSVLIAACGEGNAPGGVGPETAASGRVVEVADLSELAATADALAAASAGAPIPRILVPQIKTGQLSHRCLDADLGTINANGTKMQLWDCNNGSQQAWWFYALPSDHRTFFIQNVKSGRYLDGQKDHIDVPGDKVQLWQYNGELQQEWSLSVDGKSLLNGLSGLCLDAVLQSNGVNGTKIQLWTCNEGAQQQWTSLPNLPQM